MVIGVTLEIGEPNDNRARSRREKIVVPTERALEMLEDTRYRLAQRQKTPPTAFVEMLAERLSGTRCIGPAVWSEPKLVRNLEPSIFQNGSIKKIVDGQPVSWLAGVVEFRTWAFGELLNLPNCQKRLFEDVVRVRDTYVHSVGQQVLVDHALSVEALQKHRLVNPRRAESMYSYTQLSEDEYGFVRRADSLRSMVWENMILAVREGRVIGAEHFNSFDRLIPSTEIARLLLKNDAKREVSLLPTGRLDQAWLIRLLGTLQLEKSANVRRAVGLIGNIYKWCEVHGRRPKKDDVREAVRNEFYISGEAFVVAWNCVNPKNWKMKGRIPRSKELTSNEINDIIKRGEVEVPDFDYFG